MPVPDFSPGEILTAAAMDSVGLWRITTCTVSSTGGTAATASNGVITVGTGNTTVTINNAFSADYDNYFITWDGGVISTLALIQVYMGTAPTASAYYGSRSATMVTGAFAGAGDNNVGVWQYACAGDSNFAQMAFHLYSPYRADQTYIDSMYHEPNAGATVFGKYIGFLNNTVQYTNFTIDPQGATTMTGGQIRVYGYRK